jgi:hypothetical protein
MGGAGRGEGGYHIEAQGEVYDPYEPSLIFGRNVWRAF